MKKILSVLTLLFFGVFSLYADVNFELDLNCFTNVVNRANIYGQSDLENTYHHPDSYVNHAPCLGFENNITFYFGRPKILNFGLQIEDGLELFIDSSEFSYDWNFNMFFKPALAFQLDLSKYSSLCLAPGVSMSTMYGVLNDYDNTSVSLTQFVFETELSHKLWIVNRKDYHFGFVTGITLGVPIYGDYNTSNASILATILQEMVGAETNDIDFSDYVKGGFKFKCCVGLCFYFGERPWDRISAEKAEELKNEVKEAETLEESKEAEETPSA